MKTKLEKLRDDKTNKTSINNFSVKLDINISS